MSSDAVGEIESEGGVLVIRRINVTYRLQVEPDVDQAAIDRVMAAHQRACPVYRSLHPQIEITTALDQQLRGDSA